MLIVGFVPSAFWPEANTKGTTIVHGKRGPFVLPLATLARPSKTRPRSTARSVKTQPQAVLLGGRASPINDDSALEPEAVLIVIKGADSQVAVIAKAGVEVFGLDGAQGKFLAQLNVEPPTYRHGESGLGATASTEIVSAIAWVVLAGDTDAHPAEVQLGKWLERALASEGKPRSEQEGKRSPIDVAANRGGDRLTKIFAAAQVSREADQTAKVNRERAPATSTVKALAHARAPGDRERNRGADVHERWRCFNLRVILSQSQAGRE